MGLFGRHESKSGAESVSGFEPQPVQPGASTGPIVWRTERRRIGDLVEWEKNPRRLTEKQAADLAASMRKFGYVEEIVVNADGRSIIGGHMRRKVALVQALLNPDAVVDVRVPSRPLSESEGIELALRLNRNTGEWDFDMLANDFDIPELVSFGFENWEFGMVPPSDDNATAEAGGDAHDTASYLQSGIRKIEVHIPSRDFEGFIAALDKQRIARGLETNSEAIVALVMAEQ